MAMFEIGLLEIRDITGMSDEQLTMVRVHSEELSNIYNSTVEYQYEMYLGVVSTVGTVDISDLELLKQFVERLNHIETNYNYEYRAFLKTCDAFGWLPDVSAKSIQKLTELSEFFNSIEQSAERQNALLKIVGKIVRQPRNDKAISLDKPSITVLLQAFANINNQILNKPMWLSEILTESETKLLSEVAMINAFAFAAYLSESLQLTKINSFLTNFLE